MNQARVFKITVSGRTRYAVASELAENPNDNNGDGVLRALLEKLEQKY